MAPGEVAGVHQPQYGFANRRAADREPLGELVFVGQLDARFELAGSQLLQQRVVHLLDARGAPAVVHRSSSQTGRRESAEQSAVRLVPLLVELGSMGIDLRP
jgi:hypothetical protein